MPRPGLRILPSAMTPLCDEDGAPRRFAPWKPVVDACSLCPARCCRMTVRASVADVVRFCGVLDIPWQAGFRLVPGEGEGAFAVEGPDGPRRLDFALHQKDNGDCANLVEHGGYWRCAVYAARPSACRLYPVAYETEDRRGGAGYVLCMVPYGITPSREAELEADIERSLDGWDLHREVHAAWAEAEGPRDAGAMVQFVLQRAAEALGAPTTTLLTSEGPEVRLAASMRAAGLVK